MRRIAFLVLFVAATLTTWAQQQKKTWSVIPHVGVSVATLTGAGMNIAIADNNELELKPHARLGFTGGADVMYQATDRVGISAGLAYIQGGCNYKDIDINENVWHDHYLRADYVVVPILIHSYVAQGFSINAGLSPSFRVRGKYHAGLQSYDHDADGHKTNIREDEIDMDVKDGLRKFSLSIPIGVSYEYENVVLDARYNVGVLNVSNQGLSSRSNILEVSVGYKLNL